MKIKFKTIEDQEQDRIDGLVEQATKQVRQEALEAAIEEKLDRAKLTKMRTDIIEGRITELPANE